MAEPVQNRVCILGSRYSAVPRKSAIQFLLNHALALKGSYVCVSNVHTTMMGYWDQKYQNITNQSLLSVPDGVPLVWSMQLLGATHQDRIRGPSLMRDVCDAGVPFGLKHFLFGSKPEVLSALQKKLKLHYPGIQIVGSMSPPFRPLDEQENKEILSTIISSGAHIVWVGLGAPKQEAWMGQNAVVAGPVMVGVGAAFDLLAEQIPEAPHWMQALALEWFYRLLKEPKRLWRRYLYTNPSFVILFSLQLLFSGWRSTGRYSEKSP